MNMDIKKARLRDIASSIVAVVEPETPALVAAQLMRKHHIGSLVVVDATEQTRPIGIVTDRDLVLALMAEGLDPQLFTAGDIMSVDLVFGHPEMDLMEAVSLMRQHRLRRLVIVEQAERLVGIVAMEDVLECLARELSDLAEAMRGGRDREFSQRA
jgi:CBS domain-containing protein